MSGWIRRLTVKNQQAFFTSVAPTQDGGVVAVANFVTADGHPAFTAPWVVHLDAGDRVAWQRRLQTSDDDYLASVAAGKDFHVLTGYTLRRIDPDGTRYYDLWVVALDPATGDVLWSRAFGGDNDGSEAGRSVRRTKDGDVLVAGETSSFVPGRTEAWVLKLDPTGNPRWQNAYNADGASSGHGTGSIAEEPMTGRLLLAGNVVFQGTKAVNAWVLLLEGDGRPDRSLVFQRPDPPNMKLNDAFREVQPTFQASGPGFVVIGDTEHFRTNVAPWPDGWLLRFDTKARLLWQWIITDTRGSHQGWSVKPIIPGPGDPLRSGYLLAGQVGLEGLNEARAWFLRVDESGLPLWERIYDTSSDPTAPSDRTAFRSVVQKIPLDALVAFGGSLNPSTGEVFDKGFAVSAIPFPWPDNCPKPFASNLVPGPAPEEVTPLATPTAAMPRDLETRSIPADFDDRFICHT
jgi:outer membrane protein assembly factor BamB